MNLLKSIPLFLLLSVSVASCSNSSSKTAGTGQTDLPQTGKTIVVDVRTVEEWNNNGHAECTVNYPLHELSSKIEALKGFDKVELVCRSGNRANTAKEMLERSGIKNVENKGAWQSISCR